MKHKAYIVTGLGFGDEGKGTTVDYLTRKVDGPVIVVRHNGGAQAAHNVIDVKGSGITREKRHHTFAQFGSGTFVPGTRTHLSRFCLINPANLINEAVVLKSKGVDDNPLSLVSIADSATMITPWHVALNRLRETQRKKLGAPHGSCGQGIGETASDLLHDPAMMVHGYDLIGPPSALRRKLQYWQEKKRAEALSLLDCTDADMPDLPEAFEDTELLDATLDVFNFVGEVVPVVSDLFVQEVWGHATFIFEGAQGVLLDEWRGFHPYTTWSTTTDENARSLIPKDVDSSSILSLGVLRTYMSRHGAGPMPTDTTYYATEPHNGTGVYQGKFRTGLLDLPLLKYALEVSNIDNLVVTHMDRLSMTSRVCVSYEGGALVPGEKGDLDYQETLAKTVRNAIPEWDRWDRADFTERLTDELERPVAITSNGPTAEEKVASFDIA